MILTIIHEKEIRNVTKKEVTEKKRINFNVDAGLYSDFRKKLVELSDVVGRPVQQTDILTPLIRQWVDGHLEVEPVHSRARAGEK